MYNLVSHVQQHSGIFSLNVHVCACLNKLSKLTCTYSDWQCMYVASVIKWKASSCWASNTGSLAWAASTLPPNSTHCRWHTLSGCQACDGGIQYHLCSTYRGLFMRAGGCLVVIKREACSMTLLQKLLWWWQSQPHPLPLLHQPLHRQWLHYCWQCCLCGGAVICCTVDHQINMLMAMEQLLSTSRHRPCTAMVESVLEIKVPKMLSTVSLSLGLYHEVLLEMSPAALSLQNTEMHFQWYIQHWVHTGRVDLYSEPLHCRCQLISHW